MIVRCRLVLFLIFVLCSSMLTSCNPPPVENLYRKEGRFPGGLNVPVALLVAEWGGKPRVMGSTWLIDGGRGALFTAKHVTDALMNSTIELGANECKVFLSGRVYTCFVDRVPPLRDAVVLKILGPFNSAELPTPYKISTEPPKLKVGDTVFVQGFHSHLKEIRDINEKEGFRDMVVPILQTFYERRFGNECIDREIVFDSIEARVIKLNIRIKIDDQENDPMGELKYSANTYFSIVTSRNHKFSFGGLSGGVVVKLDKNGEPEAVGIITAEKPVEFKYDKDGRLISPCGLPPLAADTLLITPIESVKELYDYARRMR